MSTKNKLLIRLALLALLTITLMAGAKYTFGDMLTYQNLHSALHGAGWIGIGLFLAAAMVGTLLHVPAYVFLAICFLIYSGLPGVFIGIAAVTVIFTSHFLFARIVGGNVAQHIKYPYLIKTLNRLDDRPLKSVILLRLVFFMASLVTFALGLSSIRYKDFLVGSLLGISLHFTVIFLLVNFSREHVLNWLG
ncbi:MAG: hypothetical protein SH857_16420 [Chitinophagales bacterium]|nr:hypothetical protein [Chitinophagales bacterium]